MEVHRYLIALGSNVRHHRHGRPREVIRAALARLGEAGLQLEAASPVAVTDPLGPSRRRYANAAAMIATEAGPPALLAHLKRIERDFGRRRGRHWGARVLDLDILLWSGGAYSEPGLVVPHPAFHRRRFVLDPAVSIAPDWRDPLCGLSIRQLRFRLAGGLPTTAPPRRGWPA